MSKSSQGMTTLDPLTQAKEFIVKDHAKDVNFLKLKIETIRAKTLSLFLQCFANYTALFPFWADRHPYTDKRKSPGLKAIMNEMKCSKRTAQDYQTAFDIIRKCSEIELEVSNVLSIELRKLGVLKGRSG